MKTPHKHAELIKAWADGAEIQLQNSIGGWTDEKYPTWSLNAVYRVKLEPKPDVVKYMGFDFYENEFCGYIDKSHYVVGHWFYQLKLTFDGETGKLKSAEVL